MNPLLPTLIATRDALNVFVTRFGAVSNTSGTSGLYRDVQHARTALAAADLAIAEAEKLAAEMATKELM